MIRINALGLILLLLGIYARPQGIEDSVFMLQTVEVSASRVFGSDHAGMKKERVDSIVLLKNINVSLADLLSENTSVFIRNHGRGALATASFRGTAASHTQVNWNGMPINSPMTGMVDFSLVPVYIADDINLSYGPASIAGRSGGMGGSVNINNVVDWNNRLNLKYIQGVGSFTTFDEFLGFGIGNSRLQSKTRLYHNYSRNDYTFINRGIADIDPVSGEITNPEDTNRNADYTRYGLLQELYVRAGEHNIFSGRYWFQQAERTIPRATTYEGPEHSNLNRQKDVDHRFMLEWKNFGHKHSLFIRSAYAGKDVVYQLKNRVPGLGEIPAIYSESRLHSYLNKAYFEYKVMEGLSAEASIDVDYYDVSSRDTVKKAGYDESRLQMSLFFSLRKSFADRLNLKIMLRQDHAGDEFVPLVPFFGFDWRVTENRELVIRGNIARNYHHPALNDLYWQPGGNPGLRPEKGMSTEAGLDYLIKPGNHSVQAGFTAYYSDIRNWIIWVPSYKGYWEPRNISRVGSKGIEIDILVAGKLGRVAYKIAGNYAYTSSRNLGDPLVWGDESYGKQLVYVPLHSGNLMVNLSYHGFYVNYQHNSFSERYTTSSNDITRRDWLYPYYMNDLVFGKIFRLKKLSLGAELKVYNLFDETYHTVLYRPMPGRNYMLMLMLEI
jgi:iron complex outermembrane receptor protein